MMTKGEERKFQPLRKLLLVTLATIYKWPAIKTAAEKGVRLKPDYTGERDFANLVNEVRFRNMCPYTILTRVTKKFAVLWAMTGNTRLPLRSLMRAKINPYKAEYDMGKTSICT